MPGRPRAIVVVSGSELVRGQRRDLNGPYLAGELQRLGLEPAKVVIVGDRPEDLAAALHDGLAADVCIATGGLGPTHDDRTIELLARETGRRLAVDPALELEIEAVSRRIADRLRLPYADFAAGVRKQASLPVGAVSLGLAGTAPGVLLEREGRIAIALPGPPAELRRLWPLAVAHPAFRDVVGRARPRHHRVLRFFGPSESAVARALDEAGSEGNGLEVTVCARELEIHVDLFFEEGARARAAGIEAALLEEFAARLFSEDERPLAAIVIDLARSAGVTLATAESCTGGLLGAALTEVAGASDAYLGGVVAYANEVKTGQLGVPEDVIRRHGAVSGEVAAAMAEGARRVFRADVAAAVTGIAGPGGASPGKPVGLVHVHVAAPGGGEARRLDLPGDREAVRARASALTLHLLRRVLSRSGAEAA
ncbi:MAG: CinA family nicotinamide mononucleotide deamidase-related protein [Thermoleophilia bacterium]|nr:CinA family nicotinamide mononucleotide deamidase-related protein [Thermoleophilia bacterium]